ncbi:AMP-binding protein [Rahnella sp. SL6]|uniref:AMP-binding protein n=1 Tax=Yersiniaceae TaxID=1903411 RepID=UPI001C253EF5|nr:MULTISPECIES: AMP-binding protein [Yersiniaceae]MBU9808849.1 AMP-binding protein [Rahnella perminowiae]MCC3738960.1 AMP-binding protein [Rouxiella badensis]
MYKFFELTTTQQNFITAERINQNPALNQLTVAITSDIPFDPMRLKNAINTVIRQNGRELRMQIHHEGKKFYPTRDICLQQGALFVDQQDLDQAIASWLIGRSIAVMDEELIRFTLLELSTGGNLLIIESSHIIWDGISVAIFLQRTLDCYHARCEVSLYHDDYNMFVQQLASNRDTDGYRRSLNYWQKLVSDTPTVALLPLNKKHSSRKLKTTGYRYLPMSEPLSASLLTNNHPLSRFLSAFCRYYRQSTQQENLLVGIPYAGRSHERDRHQIGLYENTLPLLLTAAMAESGGDKLIRKQLLTNSFHQLVSLNDIVRHLGLKSSSSTHPLFQILVNYVDLTTQDNTITRLFISNSASLFTLSFHLLKITEQRFALQIEFDRAVYSDVDIDFLSSTLFRVIAGDMALSDVAVDPEPRISLLSEPHLPITGNKSVLNCLQQITARRPDVICLRSPHGTSLTFAQLELRSKELARYFLENFVFASDEARIVACDLTRTVDSIAVLIALLRCGMAFMPMDHKFPAARKQQILDASHCRFLVTDRTLEWVGEDVLQKLVMINVSLPLPLSLYKLACEQPVSSQQLAYCLYTSGSTGTPKGVMLSHGNLTAFIAWSLTAGEEIFRRVPFVTSFSFDLSIYEIFATLCSGGCLTVLDNAIQLQYHDDYTLLNTVPSVLEYLLEHRALPHALLRVNVAGEALSPNVVKKYFFFATKMPEFYNLYGPTEFTTYATEYHITGPEESIPIGVPIAGNQVAVINDAMEPLLRGQIGQIVLAGVNLASGYMHAPELTTQRFVFLTALNAIAYLTGDSGYIDGAGRLHYIGRQDNQVKIRGHRVELSEIELAAENLEGIGRAVACPVEHSGHKEIILCIVTERGFSTKQQVLAALREVLPGYMIPNWIYILEAFPLNHNGKIDRKVLAKQSDQWLDALLRHHNQPAGPEIPIPVKLEQQLLAICCSVLHDPFLHRDSDLIASGANSLDILQLLERIESTFSLRLNYEDIFTAPVIADLTLSIFHRLRNEDAVPPVKRGQTLYFLPGAGTLGAVYQSWFKKLTPDFAVKILNYNHDLPSATSFEALADKTWQRLKAECQVGETIHLVGHSFGGCLAYELALRSERQAQICYVTIIDSFLDFMPDNYRWENFTGAGDTRLASLHDLLDKAMVLHKQFRIIANDVPRNINLLYARGGVGGYFSKDLLLQNIRRLGAGRNITLVDGGHFSLFSDVAGQSINNLKNFHRIGD